MNTRPCDRCEHHKSKANKTPGKLIPNMHGKCTRPGGLCEEQPAPDQYAAAELADSPCQGCLKYDSSSLMDGIPVPGLLGVCLREEGLCAGVLARCASEAPTAVVPATAPVSEITEERGVQLVADTNTLAVADQAVMDAYELAKSVGRIEGIEFTRRVGEVAIAQIFIEMRNSKKYKGLPYKDAEGITRHVGTFEEFCQAFLGKSYNRCQELSQNLHVLGPDLYESAERIGFRARDYRALKALPAEDQEAIKKALAEDSTKDEALSLLQDMAERHSAERAASRKEADELKADLDARDQLLESKTKSLDKTQMELAKLKNLPPAERARLALEREAAAVDRLSQAEVKATAAVNEFLGEIADVLEAEGISIPTSEYACNLARFWAEGVGNLFAEHGIAVDFEGIVRPEWTRAAAAQGLGLEVEG